ncbi:hypothetical protein VTO42DRAFT_1921 [Malbranchea cinnamomea]
MSKTEEVEVEQAPTKRPFSAKLKAHFRKWWWLHLIIFCACVLLIALPLVYVGYPRIAQHDVNESTLEVLAMTISNPTPDSFDLYLKQRLGVSSIFRPHLDSFNATMTLGETDTPFLTVTVPALQARDGAEVIIEQRAVIEDMAAFTNYAVRSMLDETITVKVDGRTGLKLGALPKVDVDYHKVVTLKGLNKLKGFNITEFEIIKEEEDGTNMIGTVKIPNPTIQTLSLGNLTYDLAIEGTYIGTSSLTDVVIKPGDNFLPMRSATNQSLVLNFIGDYPDGKMPIQISNGESEYNGKNLTYFTAALKANEMVVPLQMF